jgi:hypothetical protein
MNARRWLAVAAVAVAVLAFGAKRITASSLDLDASQSMLMAVNLAHHGTISLAESPPYVPSDYREPVPIAVTALTIKLLDGLLGPAPTAEYFHGPRLQYLKYQNLLWILMVFAGAFGCVRVATRSDLRAAPGSSFYFSLLGAALAALAMSAGGWGAFLLNDLATDLAGAALLALATPALAAGLTRGRASGCLIAGALFGVLTLIKAATLYVFVGIIGSLAIIYLIWRARLVLLPALADLGMVTLAFLVVVVPWMLRNQIELGAFQVAQRAGVILMTRAVKDQMTPEEFRGAFYVWAPRELQGPIGSLLGFGPRDLQRGGRLQHLNRSETSDFFASDVAAERAGRPEDAVSYYRRARAERVKLENQLAAAGVADVDIEADRLLQKRAMAMIEAHPGKHLLATVAFLWRGAAYAFPILVIALAASLYYRRYEYALLAYPAFGLVMFYALLSHFIARYGLPVRPIQVVVLVIAAKWLWDAAFRRYAGGPSSEAALPGQS